MQNELFLTTRQTTKLRNAFTNNMSTNMKQLTQIAQITKIIQSGGCLRKILGNLGKKVMTDLANLLATDNLTELMSNFDSNTINKSERKTSGKGAVGGKKGFNLFISNEDLNDIS